MSLLKKPFPKRAKNRDRADEVGVHKARLEMSEPGQSEAGYDLEAGNNKRAKEDHKHALKTLKSMPNPKLLAEGGMAEGCMDCCDGMPCELHGEQDESHDMDMLSKVLGKRKMAKGGMAEENKLADFSPNEFDELEVSPPPMDNSSAGNEHGDSTLFEDAVSKVMLRRKKQHNPNPA